MNRVRSDIRWAVAFGAALCFFGGNAFARDDEYQRLSDRFDHLAADPVLGQRAPAQFDRARAALAQFKEAGRRDREALVYLVERRIDIAQASAEADYLESQRVELQRENDRLQLASARRDAAQARAELERQRLQSQIRAEEAERLQREAEAARAEGEQATQAAESARAEAAQAKRMADAQAKATALAKKEAELAAAVNGTAPPAAKGKPAASAPSSMTLADSLFVNGQSTLAAGSAKQIAKAAAFANAETSKRLRIDVSAGGDRGLAQRRATAVRDALVGAGVDASRITTAGSAAKTKRVEIALQGGKS